MSELIHLDLSTGREPTLQILTFLIIADHEYVVTKVKDAGQLLNWCFISCPWHVLILPSTCIPQFPSSALSLTLALGVFSPLPHNINPPDCSIINPLWVADGRAGWVYRGQRRVGVGVKYIEILFLFNSPRCLLLCCALIKGRDFLKYL